MPARLVAIQCSTDEELAWAMRRGCICALLARAVLCIHGQKSEVRAIGCHYVLFLVQ